MARALELDIHLTARYSDYCIHGCRTRARPFVETKEQLGGLYVLECKDLGEAIEYAAKIPSVHHGSIEVRPIMNFEEE